MSLPAWTSRIQAACFAATLDFEDVCAAASQYPVVQSLFGQWCLGTEAHLATDGQQPLDEDETMEPI